jgi:hypothetical protein
LELEVIREERAPDSAASTGRANHQSRRLDGVHGEEKERGEAARETRERAGDK